MRKPNLPYHWLTRYPALRDPWTIKEGVLYVTREGVEVSAFVAQWPDEHGYQRRWFLLFRRLGEDQVFFQPVLSQTFITSPTGSLQSSTSDATWNNANNKVECIGGGSSGAVAFSKGTAQSGTGGPGGAYSAITNFTFATPGTTTYQWQVAAGGAAVSVSNAASAAVAGNPGGSTWFNAASDPGNGADNSKCSAAGGAASKGGVSQTAALGGQTTAGWGQTKNNGGNAGATGSGSGSPSGGGGAAGPNGAGNSSATTSGTNVPSAGASGDAGSGGGGGATGVNGGGTAGSPGTELGDGVHGCGGGGGGAESSVTAGTFTGTNGGGLYGAGSGGVVNRASSDSNATAAQGVKGAQGIIVLTWTPPAVFIPYQPYFQPFLAQ